MLVSRDNTGRSADKVYVQPLDNWILPPAWIALLKATSLQPTAVLFPAVTGSRLEMSSVNTNRRREALIIFFQAADSRERSLMRCESCLSTVADSVYPSHVAVQPRQRPT